jgi:predicted molibdopterin-dependent oxidoreductase YjgC
VEKDGTFVNCHGRVQRIGRAFPPLQDSREDWRMLLELGRKLGMSLEWRDPEGIFSGLAKSVPALEALSYDAIGTQGANVATAGREPAAVRQ